MPMAFECNLIVTGIITLPVHVFPANLGKYDDLFSPLGLVIHATIQCNITNHRGVEECFTLQYDYYIRMNIIHLLHRVSKDMYMWEEKEKEVRGWNKMGEGGIDGDKENRLREIKIHRFGSLQQFK